MRLISFWCRLSLLFGLCFWVIVVVVGVAKSDEPVQIELPVSKALDVPSSLLRPASAAVDVKISSDFKYVLATIVDSESKSLDSKAYIVVWTYPEGKFVKQEAVYIEGSGHIGTHFVYISSDEQLVFFKKNEMCISSLKDPESMLIKIKLNPKYCTFDRYIAWHSLDQKSVFHFGFSNRLLPANIFATPLDPKQKQLLFDSPPIKDASFVYYSREMNALVISEGNRKASKIIIWPVELKKKNDLALGISAPITACAVSQNQNTIYAGLESGDISIFNLSKKAVANYQVANYKVTDIVLIDENSLVVGSRDSKCMLAFVDVRTGKMHKQFFNPKDSVDESEVATINCAVKGSKVYYAFCSKRRVFLGSVLLPSKDESN